MNNDLAREYNAKLIEVKDNIKQLETLNIKTKSFVDTIKDIEEETELEVEKCYMNYSKADSNMLLPDFLIIVYAKAIKRLDKINNHIISEYESYYKIQSKCNELNRKLKRLDDNIFDEIIDEVMNLLAEIKQSTTIDYREEKDLVENINKLVYKTIKLELIYKNNSSLLEYVKNDDSDISYIAELIKKDIKTLPKNEQTEKLLDKLQEIDKKGFSDIYYLDEELIILLSNIGTEEVTNKIRKNFINQIDNYEGTTKKLAKIESDNITVNDRITEIQKNNRKNFAQRTGKKILLALNMALLGYATIASIKGCQLLTQEKEYKTTTTTYDTSLPEMESIVEYCSEMPDSLSLVEYSEWEEPGYFREDYTRNVYTYDLNNLKVSYDDIKEYLTSDIKDMIYVTQQVEISSEKPEEEYVGNKYVIVQTLQDKSDYHVLDKPIPWALASIASSICLIGLDAVLLSGLSKTKLKTLKQQKKANEQELANNRQLLLEMNENASELTSELCNMRKNIEKEYAELPTVLQEDEKIKEKILLLK